MAMSDAIMAWMLACISVLLLVLGFSLGQSSVKTSCENFGAVVIDRVKYECKKVTE